MKKDFFINKSKKGFTLVELLAVIVILAIVSGLVIYSVVYLIKNSKENSYQVTINNVEKAAEGYLSEYKSSLLGVNVPGNNNLIFYCVTVNDLIDTGYFKGDLLDSLVSDDRKLKRNDLIYIEIDKSTKNIVRSALIYDNESELKESCDRMNIIDKTYKIIYDANGGNGAPEPQSYTYADSGVINLSSTKPIRTGYTFLGWSTDSNATSATYSAGAEWSLSNADNYTLYAVWSLNEVSNEVISISTRTYYQNGNAGAFGGYVGVFAANNNFVIRYTFTTTEMQKASRVKMVVTPWRFIKGDMQQLRFYITTSSSSHANANSTSYAYTGILKGTSGSYWVGSFNPKARLISDPVSCAINPSTTYYLWIFGSSTSTTGYYNFEDGVYVPTLTLTLNP